MSVFDPYNIIPPFTDPQFSYSPETKYSASIYHDDISHLSNKKTVKFMNKYITELLASKEYSSVKYALEILTSFHVNQKEIKISNQYVFMLYPDLLQTALEISKCTCTLKREDGIFSRDDIEDMICRCIEVSPKLSIDLINESLNIILEYIKANNIPPSNIKLQLMYGSKDIHPENYHKVLQLGIVDDYITKDITPSGLKYTFPKPITYSVLGYHFGTRQTWHLLLHGHNGKHEEPSEYYIALAKYMDVVVCDCTYQAVRKFYNFPEHFARTEVVNKFRMMNSIMD